MTIKKIVNLKTSPSEEKISNNWKHIKGLRLKMLEDTDWVFVKDANLTDACISSWIKWRDRVRKSKDIDELEHALEYLKALQDNQPELRYNSEKPKSVEIYKKLLNKALADVLNEMIADAGAEFGSRDLLMEKFEEAIRVKEGSTNYILLEIESDITGKTIDEVAEAAISNRKNYLTKLIKMEKSRHLYSNHIEDVESFDDCDRLLDSILMMTGKKWTLT